MNVSLLNQDFSMVVKWKKLAVNQDKMEMPLGRDYVYRGQIFYFKQGEIIIYTTGCLILNF